jgi:hypothetical protein
VGKRFGLTIALEKTMGQISSLACDLVEKQTFDQAYNAVSTKAVKLTDKK